MDGWSLKFCSPDTKENNVRLEVGRGGDDKSHRYWKNCDPLAESEHRFPPDLENADEIWIKATAENGKDVHLCVKYGGNNAQKMTFNENEEHEISQDDRDDCGC